MTSEWSSGICSCFEDCSTCIVAYMCPCYTAGKNAEAMGNSCVLHGLAFFVPILNLFCLTKTRGQIRENKDIDGSTCKDLMCVMFCGLCSLVQEAREVQAPGSLSMVQE